MKNLLFISSYPIPLDKGSNQHAFFFLKSLADYFNVYCLFFVQPEHELSNNSVSLLENLKIQKFEICYFLPGKKRGKIVSVLSRIFAFPNQYMNRTISLENTNLFSGFIEEYKIDILHIEHLHYFKYALKVKSQIKKVVVYHDLYHHIAKQKAKNEVNYLKKILFNIDSLKLYFFQKILDFNVDLKVFLNPDELKRFPWKSEYIPHIANSCIVYNTPKKKQLINLMFIGSCKHPPNIESIEFIFKQILPILIKNNKSIKLNIIGTGTERFKEVAGSPEFKNYTKIHGFIPDINNAFNDMDIAIFPILSGGGVKTKILDAMAAGVPVVTTSEGAVGLKDINCNHLIVEDKPIEFVNKTLDLIRDYEMRCKISNSAKDYYDKHNSYNEFNNKIKEIYSELSEK